MAAGTERQTMTSKEREELRRIVKGRFKVLRDQLSQREHEVKAIIRARIVDDADGAMSQIRERVAALKERCDEIETESRAIVLDATRLGLNVGYREQVVSMAWHNQIQPAGLDQAVTVEFEALAREAGVARSSLDVQELELLEKLALGGIESDEAKEFMEGIPSLDKVLPLPAPHVRGALKAA